MMKKLVLFLLMVLLLLPCANVFAEDEPVEETYQYAISLYSGDVGDFENAPEPITAVPGTAVQISVTDDVISVTVGEEAAKTYTIEIPKETDTGGNPIDSKYIVLGLKETGNDKSETIVSENISELDEDKSYVVSYGIRGTLVDYTVMYVDAAGNELHASDTYQGKVGDKMIVAAIPIDGYLPRALNVAKTLSADETENVLKIVYNAVDNTVTEYENEYEVVPGPGGGGGGTAPASNSGQTSVPEEPIEIEDQDTPMAGPDNPDGNKPDETKPEEQVIEIEDEKIPLSTYLLIGTGAGMLAIILAFLLLFFKRRRQQEE